MACALGDFNDGFALYFLSGRPTLGVISFGVQTRLEWTERLAAGRHQVRVSHRPGRAGQANLFLAVDRRPEVTAWHPALFAFPAVGTAAGGLLIGRDRGLPVTDDYTPPFPFNGVMHTLRIESGLAPAPSSGADLGRQATSAD